VSVFILVAGHGAESQKIGVRERYSSLTGGRVCGRCAGNGDGGGKKVFSEERALQRDSRQRDIWEIPEKKLAAPYNLWTGGKEFDASAEP